MCQYNSSSQWYRKESKNGKCHYDPEKTKLVDLDEAFRFYQDVVQFSGLPRGNVEGNGFQTVDYPANGEASDWMLATHGIFAMSPELGLGRYPSTNPDEKKTEAFFISDPEALKNTLSENYIWLKQTALKLMSSVTLEVENVYETVRQELRETSLVVALAL